MTTKELAGFTIYASALTVLVFVVGWDVYTAYRPPIEYEQSSRYNGLTESQWEYLDLEFEWDEVWFFEHGPSFVVSPASNPDAGFQLQSCASHHVQSNVCASIMLVDGERYFVPSNAPAAYLDPPVVEVYDDAE